MTEQTRPRKTTLVPPPATIPDADRALLAALRRALPVQRLIGNGMDYADALALHAMAEAGVSWTAAAEALGDAGLARAHAANARGDRVTARAVFRHASSCYRFGQSALDQDGPEKRQLYSRALESFAAAARLDDPPTQSVSIPWRDTTLAAWLMLPRGVVRPPCVIVFGGADGWKEEYHAGAEFLLERGIAALLLDGIGQGESRMFRGAFLTEPPEQALASAVGFLLQHPAIGDRIGIWGNSLGGNFAARAAAADPRIAACCVNSGSARPNEGFSRYKRLREKRFSMIGRRDDGFADALFESLALIGSANRIACPLLVLHGGADTLFPLADARLLYADAPSRDKTMLVWEDGDHCLYNHSHEKHCSIADWFATALEGSSA